MLRPMQRLPYTIMSQHSSTRISNEFDVATLWLWENVSAVPQNIFAKERQGRLSIDRVLCLVASFSKYASFGLAELLEFPNE